MSADEEVLMIEESMQSVSITVDPLSGTQTSTFQSSSTVVSLSTQDDLDSAEATISSAETHHEDKEENESSPSRASLPPKPEDVEVTLSTIPTVINYIIAFYSREKTLQAYRLVGRVEEVIKNKTEEDPSNQELIKAQELVQKHALLFKRIAREAESVYELMKTLDSDEGWELCRSDLGVRTWFKQDANSPTLYIKVKGVIPQPAFAVLACLNEIDLYRTWIPTCTESDIRLNISDFKKMVHLRLDPPSPINWVVSPRELILYGYGVDMMEDNKLAAMAKSPTEEELKLFEEEFGFKCAPERPETGVRMNCILAGILIEPVDATHTRVSVLSNTDPKVQVPYWLINTTSKKFAHMIFVYLREKSANLDKVYLDRIEKGAVYDDIRKRLEEKI